jgi:hypothetical protein
MLSISHWGLHRCRAIADEETVFYWQGADYFMGADCWGVIPGWLL